VFFFFSIGRFSFETIKIPVVWCVFYNYVRRGVVADVEIDPLGVALCHPASNQSGTVKDLLLNVENRLLNRHHHHHHNGNQTIYKVQNLFLWRLF